MTKEKIKKIALKGKALGKKNVPKRKDILPKSIGDLKLRIFFASNIF